MQELSSISPDAAFKDDKNFLEILHQLLDEHSCDERGGPRVISWNADGLSFQIHDAESFERRLLPAYYATSSTNVATYKAFLARLKAYGFYRVTNEGIYKDTCSHPLFVKGNRSHLSRMSRRQSFQGKDSWPMPRVMERRASCGGGAGGVVRRNSAIAQRRRSALSRPVRTIADMKRTACVRRRKSSSPVASSRGRRLSLKDTLLQRRRHHNYNDDQQQQQQQQQQQSTSKGDSASSSIPTAKESITLYSTFSRDVIGANVMLEEDDEELSDDINVQSIISSISSNRSRIDSIETINKGNNPLSTNKNSQIDNNEMMLNNNTNTPYVDFYYALLELPLYDGLRLSTLVLLISGGTGGAGDILRMTHNVERLREWQRASSSNTIISTMMHPDWDRDNYGASLDRLTEFVLADLEFLGDGSGGENDGGDSVAANEAALQKYKEEFVRKVRIEAMDSLHENHSKRPKHITTNTRMTPEERKLTVAKLRADELFGPILSTCQTIVNSADGLKHYTRQQ